MKKLQLISIILMMLSTVHLLGQTEESLGNEEETQFGHVEGRITDSKTGRLIVGASIVALEDPSLFVKTDVSGFFRITSIFAGDYTFRVLKDGYEHVDVPKVKVEGNTITEINIKLNPTKKAASSSASGSQKSIESDGPVFELDAFEVNEDLERNTEIELIQIRQQSISVGDSIGKEAFSKFALSDAAEAMTKVTGASVVDGKYVFVRGLGDRYSNTLLNGSTVPSADPDKQAVQMDQFPSDLIESITTTKSFLPNLSGTFSGGSVDIKTKSFPPDFFVKLNVSSSYNTNTTGKDIWRTEQDVSFDAKGLADRPKTSTPVGLIPELGGKRSDTVEGSSKKGDLSVAQELDRITREFPKRFYPFKDKAPLNTGFSLAIGDTIDLKRSVKLGYTASLTWDDSYSHYENGIETRWVNPDEFDSDAQIYTSDPKVLSLFPWYRNSYQVDPDPYNGDIPLGVTRSAHRTTWGAFGRVVLMLNPYHEISATYLHNQSAEDEIRHGVGDGFFSSLSGENLFEGISVKYTERGITSAQLSGTHRLKWLNNLEVDWKLSNIESTQDQPDFRTLFTAWDFEEEEYRDINASDLDPPIRRYRDMVDENTEGKLDFTVPYKTVHKIKWGGLYSERSREYNESTYGIQPVTWQGQPSFDVIKSIYTDPVIGFDFDKAIAIDSNNDGTVDRYDLSQSIAGRHFIQGGDPGNNYVGDGETHALYLMGDFEPFHNLRIVGGTRWEKNAMNVLQILEGQGGTNTRGGFESEDYLPALSLIYSINDQQKITLAYGKTLALPSFKELSPVVIEDSFTGDRFQGNSDLIRSKIDNIDLRWEWFLGEADLLAVSLFYKEMKNPIEVLYFVGIDENGDGVIDGDDSQPFQRGNIVPQNVEEGTIMGVEFEWRLGLGRFSDSFEYFSLGGNLSLIESEVSTPQDEQKFYRSPPTRQYVGQSPVLFNFDISYDNKDKGSIISLSYNYTSDRLSVVNPHPSALGNVIEKGRGSLNLTYSQQFGNNWSVKLSASNLLNPQYEKVYEVEGGDDITYSQFDKGMSFGISLTYTFE